MAKKRRKTTMADIRRAVADYMSSEGCSCCQNVEAHKRHTAELGRLLHVPMFSDKSGYDFYQFKIKKPEAGT
jgi:hypothetical protein